MWPLSFIFLIVFFRVDALENLPELKASRKAPSLPKGNLIVTPLLSSDSKKAREEAVVKPFAGDVKSYAGFFNVNKQYDTNMYFWFFPSEKDNATAPLILWLHGGPADSAMMGLFEENGPYKLVDDKVTLRETSWTKYYNVLYIDNPVGVGYSYTLSDDYGYSFNIYEGVFHLYKALTQFYKMFPEYEKNAFYLVGQSHGSKYIPVLANWIHKKNNDTKNQKINLKGIMMGAGSLDPVNQFAYAHYAYENGVLDERNRNEMEGEEVRARCLMDSGYMYSAENLAYYIHTRMKNAGHEIALDINNPHINMTDAYNAVHQFVTREEVREEIHAGDVRFFNRNHVLWYRHAYYYKSVGRELSNAVLLGYKVLLYSGQYDMVTPPQQMDRAISSLDWYGLEHFHKAPVQPWYSHGELAGYKKSFANLQQVLVRKANHMIVRSQPKWMLELLRSFAV